MAHAYAPSTQQPAAYAPDASLGDIGLAVRRRWRFVAIPTLIALAGSLAFVNIVSPRFTAEAKLLLQTSDSYFTRPGQERGGDQQPQIDEQGVASQVQVVMSRDLAREAIKRLDLVGNPEFDPLVRGAGMLTRFGMMLGLTRDPAAGRPEERVLDEYYDHLVVYPVGKSRIVSIEFRAKDADLASRAANTVAELYLGLQDDARKDLARSASSWLGTNIDSLRKRVAEAEAKVEAYRSSTGLLAGSGTTTLSAQQLSELSGQLAQARTAQADAEAKAKLIRDLIRDGRAFEIPDVANNELIRRLIEQRINLRSQLALELRTLLPQHPRIKELNAQLQDLEGQIRSAGERTSRTLENDGRLAASRVASIEAALDAQKKVVSQGNGNEVQLRALEREARTQRDQLEAYLGRYREATARDVDNAVPPDARLVSRAVAPQIPSFPKKAPIVALSTLAVLILAIGLVIARELLGGRPVSSRDGAAFDRDGRGAIPLRDQDDMLFDLSHLRHGRGSIAGAPAAASEPDPRYDFGQLIERLQKPDVSGRARRVVVTGIERGSQEAEVGLGLALTLARSAATILIEVGPDDVSGGSARAGLTDLVAGEVSFADVIHSEPGSRLHRISTGLLKNEALTVGTDKLNFVVAALEQTYDWVICTLVGGDEGELLKLRAPRFDSVVIASNLEPASQVLVQAYEAAREAGSTDVVVAREHPLADLDSEAA